MSEYFLEARNIYKAFGGIQALKNVTLKIRAGETLCLAGQNGCGKSTLIKIISGAYELDDGEIVIEGTSIATSRRCNPRTPAYRSSIRISRFSITLRSRKTSRWPTT